MADSASPVAASTFASFASEASTLLLVAGPMVFVNLLSMAIQLSCIVVVGHLASSDLALASSSVAISFSNVVGISVMVQLSPPPTSLPFPFPVSLWLPSLFFVFLCSFHPSLGRGRAHAQQNEKEGLTFEWKEEDHVG
jgi:hypothetical protein